jgi:arthrofactin-type cyclic lipopeptide synthetase C
VLHARLAPGDDGSPHWWPTNEPGVVWAGFDDLSPDGDRQAAALHALVTRDVGQALDLTAGQVARARLVRLDGDRQVLVLVLHHIVADGAASRLVVEQIHAELGGAADRRPEAASFAGWTAFQRDRAATDGFAVELAHWRRRLRGAPGPDPLPPDVPRISAEAILPELREFRWGAPAGAHARAVATAAGCTPFMVLLGGLVAALRAGGGPAEAWLATTVSQRDRPELAGTVGLLSTTAVLRIDLADEPDSGEVLRRVRRELLDAHAMAGAPFPVVAEALRDEGVAPDELARILVVAQDDLPVAGSAEELLREHAVTRPLATAYDLVVSLGVAGDEVDGSVIYKSELFPDTTIDAFLRRYEETVRSWPGDGAR